MSFLRFTVFLIILGSSAASRSSFAAICFQGSPIPRSAATHWIPLPDPRYLNFVRLRILFAMKVDKIDPSLVPRVEADDLEDYLPHEFVRVRIKLPDSMDPAKAVEDVINQWLVLSWF